MSERNDRSLLLLVGDAIGETQILLSKQIVLFQAEIAAAVRQIAVPLSLFLMSALFVLAGLLVLLVATVRGLALLLGSDLIASLVVGGAFAAVTLALFVVGYRLMSLSNLEPMRTRRQFARDRDAWKTR
ncbi:phage holin family protein [Methylobacterium sp. 77]|uniref:phage holin family protein n=1 Tax=Methylobacterium sp. 77 TaxID=1101192 RepID=UPI00037C5A8F|nr:phage holin family protein [Methylobacterium sp. 77]